MMNYKKILILTGILIVIIVLIALAMIYDANFILFRNLSIAGIGNTKENVESHIAEEKLEEANYSIAKSELKAQKSAYEVAKEEYDSIDNATLDAVKQAQIDEKYFIEYLWVVLGNYANSNNLTIDIITPGSVSYVQKEESDEKTQDKTGTDSTSQAGNVVQEVVAANNKIKIIVTGRYINLADFVFDVENDRSLRFKLDNIDMEYTSDNRVRATFDVLSLSVLN